MERALTAQWAKSSGSKGSLAVCLAPLAKPLAQLEPCNVPNVSLASTLPSHGAILVSTVTRAPKLSWLGCPGAVCARQANLLKTLALLLVPYAMLGKLQ